MVVVFMLKVINKSVKDMVGDVSNHRARVNNQINELMGVIETYPLTARELMKRLGLKSREGFRRNYLIPALEAGLIGMTIPDKPTSRNQMYFKL